MLIIKICNSIKCKILFQNETSSPAPVLGNLQSVLSNMSTGSPTQTQPSTASPTSQHKSQQDTSAQVNRSMNSLLIIRCNSVELPITDMIVVSQVTCLLTSYMCFQH